MTEFNQAAVHEAIAAAIPDRACIVWRDRRLTWAEITDRSRRVANYLLGRGVRVPVEREYLDGHESGQDHLGIYLHNGNEYLESMLGAYKARVAPFNVNYRYVAEELVHLLTDAACRALVYHEAFAPTLAAIRGDLPDLEILLQVRDGSGHDLLLGAVDYEVALASASPARPEPQVMGGDWSPDDLYILYTGGTTGLPKGVLWRQADIAVTAMGLRRGARQGDYNNLDEIAAAALSETTPLVLLPAAPFIHGAGQWLAFTSQRDGNSEIYVMSTACLYTEGRRLDAETHRLTSNSFADDQATWSPDGSHLVFQSNRDGDTEIYTMKADGSKALMTSVNPDENGTVVESD